MIADASYSSLADIARVQAGALFGNWAKAFVPGALFWARYRADFDPSEAAPAEAIEDVTIPTLLVQSTTDDFTPYEQTDEIYANSNHDHTVYELTTSGALHASSYVTDPITYTEFVDQFLATYVPDFGAPRPPADPES